MNLFIFSCQDDAYLIEKYYVCIRYSCLHDSIFTNHIKNSTHEKVHF